MRSSPATATLFLLLAFFSVHQKSFLSHVIADDEEANLDVEGNVDLPKVEENIGGAIPDALTTDSQVADREKESISSRSFRSKAEKFEFQAEVSRLMDIIINSLYSNKDIFLRELISNASDALDKIRFLSLTEKEVLGEGDNSKLEIQIKLDKTRKILSIRDRGIGMTKEDLIKNLGTIAKSGTSAFLEQMQKGGDLNLIGQFGVGFYSVYLVADYVEVLSKHNDDKQYIWESKADGAFAVSEDTENETLGRGTEIRLHFKEEANEYLQEEKLKELVKKYSEFINFPIYLWASKEVEVEVEEEEDTTEKAEDATEKTDEVETEKKTEDVKTEDVKDSDVKTGDLETTKTEDVKDSDVKTEDVETTKTEDVKDSDVKTEDVETTKTEGVKAEDVKIEEKAEEEIAEEKKTNEKETDDEEEDEDEDDEKSKPKTKKVKETTWDWELLNDVKAIWLRSPKEVTEEEYASFFRSIAKDLTGDKPLSWTHFNAEGDVEFKSILFIPPRAPYDLYENYYSTKSILKFYVRRVFISDEFEELLPKYLNFLKGIVDSDTLPLNVSREVLQQNSSLKTIKKKLIRKALDMIRRIAEEDPDESFGKKDESEEKDEVKAEDEKKGKYTKFWNEFGKSIKLGIIEDSTNRNRLAKLLRFYSTKSGDKLTSLDEYISRMKPKQDIYYLTGASKEKLEKSPFLEQLIKKDYEVILFTDPIDEYLMQYLMDYEDKKFQNISKEGLKLGKDSKIKELKEEFKDLTKWWKDLLANEKVDSVKISNRLSDTPGVVVTSKYSWSANMERIMQSQTLADSSRQSYMRGKRVLEINPKHPIIKELRSRVAQNPEDEGAKLNAKLIYQTALIESGFSMDDPKDFATHIYTVIKTNLNVSPDAIVEEDEDIEDEPENGSAKKEEKVEGSEEIEKDKSDEINEDEAEDLGDFEGEEAEEDELESEDESDELRVDELENEVEPLELKLDELPYELKLDDLENEDQPEESKADTVEETKESEATNSADTINENAGVSEAHDEL